MNNSDHGFKRQLKSHYQRQQLTPEQIHALQVMKTPSQGLKTVSSVAIASSILAGLGIYLFQDSKRDYQDISKQIAYNHNIKLQMEVLSPNFNTVQNHLNKLGFTLVSSSKVPEDKWKIIGGRYCNINGKVAAQMQVVHADSKNVFTFYQAKLPEGFVEPLQDNEIAIDGVKIKLWREKGLLMGLAF